MGIDGVQFSGNNTGLGSNAKANTVRVHYRKGDIEPIFGSMVGVEWTDTICHANENVTYVTSQILSAHPVGIVSNMHKAIDGLGTDDKLFEKVLNVVDEYNAVSVWGLWNETYGKEYGENFYESFMNDADKSQKAKFSEKLQKLFKRYLQPEK